MSPILFSTRSSPSLATLTDHDPVNPAIPLKESTINHLRQAIRAQSQGITHLLKTRGSKILIHKRIDIAALERAGDSIKAHFDDVLDLEIEAASARHRPNSTPAASLDDQAEGENGKEPNQDRALRDKRLDWQESSWQYSTPSEDDGDEDNELEHQVEGHEGVEGEARTPKDSRYSNNSNDGFSNAEQYEQGGSNSNLEDDMISSDASNQEQESEDRFGKLQDAVGANVKDVTSGDNQSQGLQSAPATPATPEKPPPQSPQGSPKTPPPKATVFSRLAPSRLFNLFIPTPSPTPV
ncbi:MAG: hypothetical protein Q9225_004752, partial [Loekoesia sp. 1 TL-2023]